MTLHFDAIIPSLPYILEGVVVTLKFTFFSLLLGLPLAILLAIGYGSTSKVLSAISKAYVSIFRGTPLLVQLGLFYFGVPQLTGYNMSAFEAGVLTFALNSAAYTCEIIRSGINAIDKGQWEACKVLGLSNYQTFRYVILPQAFSNILPALVNELVNLLKESALVSTIGELDLLKRANNVAAEKFLYFEPLLVVGACYYVLVLIISYFANRLEKNMHHASH